jgi:SPP1 family phage portal protein
MQTTQDILTLIESDNLDTISMMLEDLVKTHRLGEGNSLRQLYKRYMLKNVPIYERKPLPYEKIDRRTANDFYGDIVDTKAGYMGNSVSVDLDRAAYDRDGVFDESDYEADMEWLNNFSLDNDSEDRNSELVRMAAMCGKAYRQLYLDSEGLVRIQNIDPWEIIYIKDHSLDEPQLVLRYYEMAQMDGGNKKQVTVVEWYDSNTVRFYIDNGDLNFRPYREDEWRDNLFSRIPILLFKNNEYETAEPYKVTDLMDAYDAIISATTSEIEQLRLAYMFIKDSGLYIDKQFMQSLEQTGIFPLSENGEVGFINKQLADAPVNNLLAEIRRNIYQFAKSIDMSKEFGGEMRVIGWQVALLNLENSCKITERKFKRALREQYRILTDHWREFKGVDVDVNDLEFTFTRNFPKDIKAEAETLQLLLNSVSTKTAFAQMSFIDQPEKEMERIEQERDPFRGMDGDEGLTAEPTVEPSEATTEA